jgi:uncharacterized protein YxjI
VLIVVLAVAVRVGRDVIGRTYGWGGLLLAFAALVAIAVGWRLFVRHRARRHGVVEHTPEMVRRQVERSGVAPPAFPEDGTLVGASVLAVNQRSKLIEVETEYLVFDSEGRPLGHVRQVRQGRLKRIVRFVGPFDQFFTHHFEISDCTGAPVLRLTRPRKLFKSRVEVFDPAGRTVGRIVQRNVFGKIDFGLFAANGELVAMLKAENWRAWDFRVELPSGVEIARLTKTWEGFARTYLTNADQYVVRVHQVLGDPLRTLVFAAILSVDVALKQDPRGLSAG